MSVSFKSSIKPVERTWTLITQPPFIRFMNITTPQQTQHGISYLIVVQKKKRVCLVAAVSSVKIKELPKHTI